MHTLSSISLAGEDCKEDSDVQSEQRLFGSWKTPSRSKCRTAEGRAATAHEAGNLAWYLPFAAMCIAAPILVLVAAAQRRLSVRSSRAGLGPLVERAN